MSSTRGQVTASEFPDLTLPRGIYGQGVILALIKRYCKINNRDAWMSEELSGGFCNGLVALVLYAVWLETQPKRLDKSGAEIPRDDWAWLKKVLTKLTTWDLFSPFPTDPEIDRFIAHLNYLHRSMSLGLLPIAQTKLDELIEDTQRRTLHNVYSIAGVFYENDLLKEFAVNGKSATFLDTLLDETNFVTPMCNDHITLLFKRNGTYYFYDPNNTDGFFITKNHDEFVRRVLRGHNTESLTDLVKHAMFKHYHSNTISFKLYSFDLSPRVYPPQAIFLDNLQIMSESKYNPFKQKHFDAALHAAIKMDCNTSVAYYLQHGADINSQIETSGVKFTLHSIATISNNTKVSKLLLENKGIDVNEPITKAKDFNLGPLICAVDYGLEKQLEILLNHKNIDLRRLYNYSDKIGHIDILHDSLMANPLFNNGEDISLMLIDKMSHLEHKNAYGCTPLMVAAIGGRARVIRKLCERGVDINAKSNNGRSALSFSVREDKPDITSLLLELKADINIINQDSKTPLMIAAENGNLPIVKLLTLRGADLNHKSSNGETALDLAIKEGNFPVANYLSQAMLKDCNSVHLTIEANIKTAISEKLTTEKEILDLKSRKTTLELVFLNQYGMNGLKEKLFTLKDIDQLNVQCAKLLMTEDGIHWLKMGVKMSDLMKLTPEKMQKKISSFCAGSADEGFGFFNYFSPMKTKADKSVASIHSEKKICVSK